MLEDVIIEGVETNNLKNINVRIQQGKLNLILGPSGSGKRSEERRVGKECRL